MIPDPSTLELSTALEALHRHDFSVLELTEACFRQIQKFNPTINAFITPALELAVQAAMRADVFLSQSAGSLEKYPLLGLPLAVKDLIDVAGLPTTAGSRFFGETPAAQDAHAVEMLGRAGAIVLGKTNTHEFALGVTGVNPHFGAVRNPWDLSRISGGSSSGSAAAVASGMCLGALGTDTGGSIRIPASLCGVVGLKPTYGRVSTRGVLPLSWNLDHVGPLTRTVRDAALLLSVLAGYDPDDPVSADVPAEDYQSRLDNGVREWRIACAVGEYAESCDGEILAAFGEARRVFKELGANVTSVNLDWIRQAAVANGCMTQVDAAAFHRNRMVQYPDRFGPDVLERLRAGAATSSSDYAQARRTQSEVRRRFEKFFGEFDLLILPTTPIPAPPIAGTEPVEAANRLTRFTSPFNLAGLPALSLPCGFTTNGLPIGLQIVSKAWAEVKVLQAGLAFERVTEWHLRRPDLQVGP
jgi:aspartyl-tRNA(Asn)/glutamyl-tRNA(Gln) amidotransferase subunit A